MPNKSKTAKGEKFTHFCKNCEWGDFPERCQFTYKLVKKLMVNKEKIIMSNTQEKYCKNCNLTYTGVGDSQCPECEEGFADSTESLEGRFNKWFKSNRTGEYEFKSGTNVLAFVLSERQKAQQEVLSSISKDIEVEKEKTQIETGAYKYDFAYDEALEIIKKYQHE